MARNISYNTKQKDLILDIIKNQKKEFTVKDIYEKSQAKTGLTTIYRLVDKLTKEGTLSKTIGNDNNAYYQYLEKCNHENHFYLKCNSCGMMEHVDCDCIKDLSEHISKKHKFKADKAQIIIKGICEKCIRMED